jgi:hypothetical protein
MKKIQLILLAVLISFSQFQVSCQIDSTRKVFVGLTAGMSFFDPSGVNQYIKNTIGDVTVTQGFSDIILNLNGSLSIIYKINDRTDISGIFDIAIAPKIIYYENESGGYTFNFYRLSPGAIVNLYFGNSKESKFVLGGGVLLNFMGFEDFSGVSPSLRLQAGQNFQMGSVIVKCLGVINIMPPANSGIQLNYTDIGACIGIEF